MATTPEERARGTAATPKSDGAHLFDFYEPDLEDQLLKILMYGPQGSGKTTLIASAQAVPEMADVLIVNVEGGMLSLADPKIYGAKKKPKVYDYSDYNDFKKLLIWLKKEGHKQFKTLGIDSYSHLMATVLKEIAEENPKKQGEDTVNKEDYGTQTIRAQKLAAFMRHLPMNVIAVTHELAEEETGVIGPNMRVKIKAPLEALFDIEGRLWKSEVKDDKEADDPKKKFVRKALFQPIGKYTCKDRSPGERLPTVIENPNMQIIRDYVVGKRTK